MRQLKAGLLPLYIELYDKVLPKRRPGMEDFYRTIAAELSQRGLEIVTVPVCRLESEVSAAVRKFEQEAVHAIVTLHLAYSPSLESAGVLAASRLPIIVLDTTPDSGFGPGQDPTRIMYNHGIHGVQDLCNVLLRNGKAFQIETGHWQKTDVLDRVVAGMRASLLAAAMRSARVGLVGQPFSGMGDFAVPFDELKNSIGVETISLDPSEIQLLLDHSREAAVRDEMAADRAQFRAGELDEELHYCTARTCIALRRWIDQENLSAFTMNFLAIEDQGVLPTVPFLEASKAMARGLGYAGEGDVLTAALVGSLLTVYPETTFTEMFCPDWDGNSIFLSHMGEVNLRVLAAAAELKAATFPFHNVKTPIAGYGRYRAGEATLANLAPAPNHRYRLIVAPVTVLGNSAGDRFGHSVHGWIRTAMPVADFLAAYSRVGGTHHLAMVYGTCAQEIARMGEILGWELTLLE